MDQDLNKKIDEFLSRGVEDVFVKENLRASLLSGRKLRVKLGIDPTSPHIHIGRAIILRKLKFLQDLGHKVVFIVGDFTAKIGDPSDKLSKRPMLTDALIKANMKTYKAQVGKILNLRKAEFYYNSKWLRKLNFADVCNLAETFSLQQMTARRNFSERIEKGEEISLRELMYPLMQGYDSVAVKADIELGGFDQLFNLKAGRVIQKHFNMKEQDVVTFSMLIGTDGRKMSSSWGNVIAIDDTPKEIYGKVMTIKDEFVEDYFTLATDISMAKIAEIKKRIEDGENPKMSKMELAREIVRMFYGDKEAQKAEEDFISVFSKKEVPNDSNEVLVENGTQLSEAFLAGNIVKSKSEFSRLVKEGAVTKVSPLEKRIEDIFAHAEEGTYKVGKHRFLKIKIK
jgi:tyrosyl-tRNA synthetase